MKEVPKNGIVDISDIMLRKAQLVVSYLSLTEELQCVISKKDAMKALKSRVVTSNSQ